MHVCSVILCEQHLGLVGRVLSDDNDFNVHVLVGNRQWVLSPGVCTLEKASSDPESELGPDGRDSDSSSDESVDDSSGGRTCLSVSQD